jgi:hypothetical protein
MFELMKPGGQCAVIVSEGFNTWDQFSAKALRKILLDEAQLKAVISLPQGIFVSKSDAWPNDALPLTIWRLLYPYFHQSVGAHNK